MIHFLYILAYFVLIGILVAGLAGFRPLMIESLESATSAGVVLLAIVAIAQSDILIVFTLSALYALGLLLSMRCIEAERTI